MNNDTYTYASKIKHYQVITGSRPMLSLY